MMISKPYNHNCTFPLPTFHHNTYGGTQVDCRLEEMGWWKVHWVVYKGGLDPVRDSIVVFESWIKR